MKTFLLTSSLITVFVVSARAELMKDFDSLGGNEALIEKAKVLQPEKSEYIVQNRTVDRRNRVEIAPEFTSVMGGDAYLRTQMMGMNAHYHITPRWSAGVKYGYMANQLRPEGENLITDTTVTGKAFIPAIDYPKQEILALINWYPIYGKMNLLEKGVLHFDLYLLAGAGQIELKSGNKTTYTAGTGIGMWFSQHLTSRLEFRYQNYKATNYTGENNMDLTLASLQMGYLL